MYSGWELNCSGGCVAQKGATMFRMQCGTAKPILAACSHPQMQGTAESPEFSSGVVVSKGTLVSSR